jgi:hypothetical protein
LFKWPFGEKISKLRLEYDRIFGSSNIVFSKWEYLIFTDKVLLVSPITLWEFLTNKPGNRSLPKLIECIDALKPRFFSINFSINPLTYAIGVLFASATGVSCNDSYNYIHAIRNSADFFASDDKDFNRYDPTLKDDIIINMKKLSRKYKPISQVCSLSIGREINRISKKKWPKMISTPTDIPEILRL